MPLFLLLVMLLLSWASPPLADTTCPALRDIRQQQQAAYFVYCSDGKVPITIGQYHSNAGKHGNFAQFCPTSTFLSAVGELRWQTASELPETCDVFTVQVGVAVVDAAFVYFQHSNGEEQEIDTAVHTLVWQGSTLRNFNPPVPGIIVEP